MRKTFYDATWTVAAFLGALAVFAADGSSSYTKPALPWLLGTAIAIAGTLSLFVQRQEKALAEECPREDQPVVPAPDAVMQPEASVAADGAMRGSVADTWDEPQMVAKVAAVTRNFVSGATGEDLLLQQKQLHIYLMSVKRSLAVEQSDRIRAYLNQQQASRRRNILSEACELAKQLQGTGAEIAVSPDNFIVIRERRGIEVSNVVAPRELKEGFNPAKGAMVH